MGNVWEKQESNKLGDAGAEREQRDPHKLILKDSIFLNDLLMHWLRSLKEHTSDQRRSEFKYFDFVSKSQASLAEICSAWL